MLELTDSTAGTLLSGILAVVYLYWMAWLVLLVRRAGRRGAAD